jgi:hypothetical protein
MCETIPLAEVERLVRRWYKKADRLEELDLTEYRLAAQTYRACARQLTGSAARVGARLVTGASQPIQQDTKPKP